MKHHEPEIRAAVMAALLAGRGVCEVARQHKLPESTVSRWRADARRDAGLTDDVGQLLMEYLTANLTTLRAQAVAFRDPAWLREQPAGELGVLHGILCDKSIRLLEALDGGPVNG